ncbi:MAG: zinc ribbon domain-containing protein, partial [Micromonosporaceae bacterium]|nr:zinc ribbon domain-containing protein [Micromonosporaceae bacterium]
MAEGTFALVAEREVAVPVGRARAALAGVLRDVGFTIESEHTTLLVARRGSTVGGAMLSQKLPVSATLRFAPADAGCRIEVRLEDGFAARAALGSTLSETYHTMLSDLGARLDAALGTLDPAAEFPPARYSTGQVAQNNILDLVVGTVGGAASHAFGVADRRLFRKAAKAPQQWALVRAVEFTVDGTAGPAVLIGREEVDGMLAVAALVGDQPEQMPPSLVDHVARLATRVESGLDTGRDVVTVALTERDVPALTFLRRQTVLRDALSARRLLICRDCRQEKVVNDEYQRIAERDRRVNELINRVTEHNPAIMLRQLFRRGVPPPAFVCDRCQGLSADQLIITFCPSCGAQHREGALRTCSCGFDFVSEGERRLAVRPPFELPPLPVPAPAPAPPPGPS